jgi:hypothetical protein
MTRNGDHSTLLHIPYDALAYVMTVMAASAALLSVVLAFVPRKSKLLGPASE